MKIKGFWVEFFPINPATGLPVRVRVCSINSAAATGIDLSNGEFMPYMTTFPDTEIAVFDGAFSGESSVSISNIEASDVDGFAANFPSYVWDGTDVIVYKGDSESSSLASLQKVFSGVCTETPEINEGEVSWTMKDKLYLFDVSILTETYSGEGGINGTSEMAGVYKPFAMGEPLNVEPILIDPAYLIYQYHGYGPTEGVVGLYENGLGFGAGQTPVAYNSNSEATFQDLRNADLEPGEWVDCPSIGMFRLGGEPVSGGVITADVRGHAPSIGGSAYTRIDDCIELLVSLSDVDPSLVDANSFDGLYSGSGNQTLSDYTNSSSSLLEVITSYMAQCGGYPFINSEGHLRFGFVRLSTPALEIRTDGTSSPSVESAISMAVSAPYKRLRMGGDKVFRVHNYDEISDALRQSVMAVANALNTVTTDFYLAVNDGNLTIQEKIQVVIPDDTAFAFQYASLRARALVLGLSVTALDAAQSAYATSRDLITPAWNDTTQNSTGIPSDFRAKMAAFGNALITMSTSISQEDAKRSNWSGVTNDNGNRPDDNADVTGDNTAAAILLQGALATLNDVDWQTKVVGVGKPANNAGTANILVPFGNYSTVSANSVSKSGGTHGAFEGGAVGVARKSAVFISCSVVTSPTWWTHITLDTVSATNTNTSAAGVWLLRFISRAADRILELYKNGSLVGSWLVAGVATSTDRIALVCNGVRVFAMLNGVVYGGDTSAYNATANATYWPKVMDFYNTADSGHSIDDIQYGAWTDVRTFLDDGITALPQSGYKTDEGTAAAIAGQGPGATASADSVLNSYAPYGQNLIPLSDQAADTIFFLYNNPDSMTLNYPVAWAGPGFSGWTTSTYILGGNIKASVAYQPGRVASPTVGYANFGFKGLNNSTSNDITWSVSPGDRMIASCYMHHHRCGGGITVCLVDSTGTNPTLYYNVDTTGLGEGGTCYSLSQYERIYKLVTVPAGYNVCVLYIRKNNTNVGEANSYLWWAAPMLERAAPNQTTPSPYQPGPPTGTLAGKTNIDLGSGEVVPNGGIPPTIPDNGFTYTATVSSITISWPTMTVYRSNGTTISIASGSQSCTALSSSYSWKFYPYIVDNGGSSATVQFAAAQGALGTYYGTQQIAYLTSGSVAAKAYVNQLGRIDMGSFNAATTSGGTGGGGGGGWNCLHGDMLLRNGRAIEAEVGDTVDTPEGTSIITDVRRWPCSEWIELWNGDDMIAKVTRRHLFYKSIDGKEIAAEDVKVGDLICGRDSHIEVTGIKLCTLPSTAVGIGIDSPHQHYAGQRRVLCHNGTQKP